MARFSLDRPAVVTGIAASWWLLVGLVSAANHYGIGADGEAVVTVSHALSVSLVSAALWVPLTLLIYGLVRRFPLRRATWPSALAVHMFGAVMIVVVRALLIYSLDPWLHWYPSPPRLQAVLMHSVENNLFLYWLFVGVGHAVVYARDAIERDRAATRLEVELSRAELSALKSSLHPHFLFNTLQAVAELVHQDPAAADRMIVQLSAMLRRLLDDGRQVVPLSDELAFVRDYLELEQVRFSDRLVVTWDVAPEVLGVSVPHLMLQPLAENALRHGLWPAGRPGRLEISAQREGDELVVTVSDDGVGLGEASAKASAGNGVDDRVGHGLATVRARVERLYRGRGHVALRARRGAGAESRVVIPLGGACAL
jgi:two-component system, LytTR family, sensor kinase